MTGPEPPFDVLLSADALVPDHDAATEVFVRELGMQRLPERHIQRPSGQGASWSFPRIHPDRDLAPTMLEILDAEPPDPTTSRPLDYAYLPEIAASQGDRPVRCHSTPIGATDLDAVVEHLRRRGARFRLDEPTDRLPFPRLWIGHTRDEPGIYDPVVDGGLRLEFVPSSANKLSLKHTAPPERSRDGTIIRVLARTFLVPDLTGSLRALEANFGWPADPVVRGGDGVDRATLRFRHPRSSTLELLTPTASAEGYEADFFRVWGPGPLSIRFAVDGLEARRTLLQDIAPIAPAALLPEHAGERVIRLPERGVGTAFEFVEWDGR